MYGPLWNVWYGYEYQPELAKRFGIKALPTFVYFRKGKEVYRNAGGMALETIHKELSKLLYRI